MAIHYIPIQQSEANYRIGVTLVGVAYWFDFRWNVRDSAWFLDVYDATQVPIWVGIKCVIGTYLGRACQQLPFTDGALMCFDTSGAGKDAGFGDFGTRVRMAYLPTIDLLATQNKVGVK